MASSPKQEMTISFCNCSCLTRRSGQLNEGKVYDVLSFVRDKNCHAMFMAETGVTDATHIPPQPQVEFDFIGRKRALPGYGVAIFNNQLRGKWTRVGPKVGPCNFGAWLICASSGPLLVGVMCAPQPGHGHEARETYFREVHQTWERLLLDHPSSSAVLVGDMNLPTLLRSTSSTSERITGEALLNHLFTQLFWDGNRLLSAQAPLQPTHIKGNILDLAIVSSSSPQEWTLRVHTQRVAGSDHFPLVIDVAGISVLHEHETPRWSAFRNFPVQLYIEEVSPFLYSLHAWLASQSWPAPTDPDELQRILIQGAALMGSILLAVLFQVNSPFGRFSERSRISRKGCLKLSAKARLAVQAMRLSRGAACFQNLQRKANLLLKAQRLRRYLHLAGRTEAGQPFKANKRLFDRIRDEISPNTAASQMISVHDNFLDDEVAADIWVEFLRLQTSWSGQSSPEALYDLHQGIITELPHLDPPNEASSAQLRESRQWLRESASTPVEARAGCLVQWTELCDAVAGINASAAAPSTEPIPVSILKSPCEPFRACLIGLLNLTILCDVIPPVWRHDGCRTTPQARQGQESY